jgi:hypothetical protein
MIPTAKNTIHFQQRLLPNCLKHDLEIVIVAERSQAKSTHRSLLLSLQESGKKLSPVIL